MTYPKETRREDSLSIKIESHFHQIKVYGHSKPRQTRIFLNEHRKTDDEGDVLCSGVGDRKKDEDPASTAAASDEGEGIS